MIRKNYLSQMLLFSLVLFLLDSPLLFATPNCGGTNVKIGLPFSNANYKKPAGLNKLSALNLADVNFENAFNFGGSDVTQIGKTVVDANGNRYVTGGFTGTLTFGSTTLTSSNGYDLYVAKFDASNTLLWARMAKGDVAQTAAFSLDGGLAITVDELGEVYIGGGFVKSLTFVDESDNTVEQLTDGRADANINVEMFIAKYSTDGDLLWAVGGNSQSTGAANSLAADVNNISGIILDSDGYPYITGQYSGTDFLGTTVTSFGKSDFFLASLDKDGSLVWVSTAGTPDDDMATSISVDKLGYLNVLGIIGSGIMELPNSTQTWDNSTGEDDTFVISYDVNGDWYFVSFLGAGEQVLGNAIATTAEGDFYVTGYFNGSASFEGSPIVLESTGSEGDGFIAKYDIDGDAIWAKQFGHTFAEGNRIVVDDEGNAFILGTFSEEVVFAEDTGEPVTLTSSTASDMFIAKYDSDGNFLWAKHIVGSGVEGIDLISSGTEIPFRTQPLDLTYSAYNGGEIILSGDFVGSIDLDDLNLTSATNVREGFLAAIPLSATTNSKAKKAVGYVFMQNYPNPFTTNTVLSFTIPKTSHVKIEVYNSNGHKISTPVNDVYAGGSYEAIFDASDLEGGLYTYTIQTDQYVETRKMSVIK